MRRARFLFFVNRNVQRPFAKTTLRVEKQILLVTLCGFLLVTDLLGQDTRLKKRSKYVHRYNSRFQLSIFPGISTNGINSGSFVNDYSLNLFGGLSVGNRKLELSPITNLNLRESSGLQVAGLANIIGANSYVNLTDDEIRQLKKEKSQASFRGLQLAGILNYVQDTCAAVQFSGVMNFIGGNFQGLQIAGVGNRVGGLGRGAQLASLYNVTKGSMAALQISLIYNKTGGMLTGFQIGATNNAGKMTGRNSTPRTPQRGVQIGLINFCRKMDGTQIGLINIGGTSRGKQFGVINFFSNETPHEKDARNGTPVGLLNISSSGTYIRFYHSDLFAINLERASGNCLNCSRVIDSEMPFSDDNQIFNENVMILGFDPSTQTWGFGYGFQKVLYNKSTMMPSSANKRRMINYGVKFIHVNRSMELDRVFNLVTRLNFDFGKRFGKRYVFGSISLNYFLYDRGVSVSDYKIRGFDMSSGNFRDLSYSLWLGYEIGIQL